MSIPVPMLLQGAEWGIIVLLAAIPIFVVGLIIYVLVKVGLAGAGALSRVGRNSTTGPAYVTSGSSPGFCSSCGAALPPGSKFCLNCGRQL